MANEPITADGLIAVLGWAPDDFESAARRAPHDVLEEARKIASATYEGESQHSIDVSAHAVRFISDLLAGNNGNYWERAGEKTKA